MQNMTAVQKSRLRSLKEGVRKMKAVIQGLNQIHEREKNPEKAAEIMESIQEKCGILVSMENQIKRYEEGGS